MACTGCERRRQAMKAMRDKAMAHAARLLNIRKGAIYAESEGTSKPDETGAAQSGEAARVEPADHAGAEHEQRGVEKAAGSGAGARSVSVPRVRKGRRGEAGAR